MGMKSILECITESLLDGESETWIHIPDISSPIEANDWNPSMTSFEHNGSHYRVKNKCMDMNGDKHFYMEKI